MPVAKCGGCAKFLSPIDAAKCSKCKALYHRVCVNLPNMGYITPTWCCPECVKNVIRDNKAETPVRGRAEPVQAGETSSEELMDTSPLNNSALDATVHFSPGMVDELRLFKEEMRAEFRLIHQEFEQLRTEMVGLKDSIKTSNERMDNLESRVNALELKLELKVGSEGDGKIESTIAELRCQLNERDQELLLNDIEVSGIPENKDESALHLVKVVALKLGVDLDERDIVHAERVGSTHRNRVENTDGSISASPAAQRSRSISVRFARRTTRDVLLRAARVRRGLSTDDLEMTGLSASTSRRVYINERLTRLNRQLFYHARQAGSQHNWKYVWTKDGKVLARKEDRQKAERIRCLDDVTRIFC